MNINEFAKLLNGREMGNEIDRQLKNEAHDLGFVVVFGYSDDNTEFAGVIDDEVGCYGGEIIYLDGKKILEHCEEECGHWQKVKEKCKIIEAIWCGPSSDIISWTYKTDIPHAVFEIMEDDEVFCEGIVFDINNLEGNTPNH